MDNSLINRMFEKSIRAEEIIHLGTMAMQDGWASSVKDAFFDDTDEIIDVLSIPIDDRMTKDEIAEKLMDAYKLGWLVKFATPIPSDFYDNGNSFSISWGMYTSQWFYGESYEAVCQAALAWRPSIVDHYRNKWKKEL